MPIWGTRDERIQDYALDSGISKFDLTAAFTETPDGAGRVDRVQHGVVQATDHRAHGRAFHLPYAGPSPPHRPPGSASWTISARRKSIKLLVDFNDTQADYPNGQMHS